MDFEGVRVAVVGLAKSGLAAVELLASKHARVTACDARPLGELPGVADTLERLRVPFRPQAWEALANVEWIVLSPGVPADLEILARARQKGIRVVGEVELAGFFLQGETIGITGTNGKTTTTALAGHILQGCGIDHQVGGNIGTVPAAAMAGASAPGRWNVLELSSFQLETIEQFRARVAVVLNITEDHLDRHYTFEAYTAAKARLLETQRPGDFAVLNADDPVCAGLTARTRARVHWFSLSRSMAQGIFLDRDNLVLQGRPFLEAKDIPLRGRHNVENVMAASLAAHLAGATHEGIAAAIRTFRAVEHRLEFVRRVKGVDYYNDSKATNVDSTLKAIEAFDVPLWVILGGKDKGGDYSPLAPPLARQARGALLVGAASPKIAAALGDAVPMLECGTLHRAVAAAFERAVEGDAVLLAPACASFDQFENFEHRGRAFKQLVAQLEEA